MPDYEEAKKESMSRVRHLESLIVLYGVVSLILLGPLGESFGAYPVVLFASALFLFMVPGVLLTHWFLGERFFGAALIPVGFVLSTGLLGMLGVPLLILHLGLQAYMWVVGMVVSAFLLAAMFRVALRKWRPVRRQVDAAPAGTLSSGLLWVPFLLLSGALALVSRLRVPHPYNDIWVYLAYVREFLSADNLALYEPYFGRMTELSRAQINGWLLVQASLSRISGIDPVDLVVGYLAPTLVVVALLAFYALGRTILRSEAAALLAGCLCALFFLVNLSPSLSSFGGEFVGRIAEDKFVARFLFLPVSLALAFVYLEGGGRRYVGAFGLLCCSVMAVHPVGLAIIGLSVGGFGLVHVALNLRDRAAWARSASLGAVLLGVVSVPALIVFAATGEPLTVVLSDADINSNDPDVLANMAFVKPRWKHLYELGDGSYIMHPSLVLDPVVLGALLLGTPFLLRRLKRSVAAQLLFGVLLLATVVCYAPPVATFVGDHVVLPGQLWRLAWPIPLAALLTLGWMAWVAIRRAGLALGRLGGVGRGVARTLPLALVVTMAAVVTPSAVSGVEAVHRTDKEIAKRPAFVFDPFFGWMRDNIEEPSVVLAPDAENTYIPAYSASANVVSLRGAAILDRLSALERRAPGRIEAPRRALDVRRFYRDTTPEEKAEILRRYEVDYVVLRADSPLGEYLDGRPGFTLVETPGEWYRLYAVDLQRLGEGGGHLDDG